MNPRSAAARRFPWPRWLGLAVVWIALLVWAFCYRMPYDLRIRIFGWSYAAAAGLGLGMGLGRYRRASQTRKTGWQRMRATLGLGLGVGSLVGIAVFCVLVGANGTFRSQVPFVVDGVVEAKRVTSGRGTTYLITVHEEGPQRSFRFNLDRDAYERIRVGDRYREEFQIGLFGWPCRPR